jgi:hypothetical protein
MIDNTENKWSIFAKKYIHFFLSLIYTPKIMVLAVFYAVTLVCFYLVLNFFGRIDLFPLVINLTSFFQIIIPTFIIVMIGVIWILLIPSFGVIFLVTKWIPKSFFRKVSRNIILLSPFTAFLWLALVSFTNDLCLTISLTIIISYVIYVVSCRKNIWKYLKFIWKRLTFKKYNMLYCHLRLYSILILSAILTCFPLHFIFNFIDLKETDNLLDIIVLLFCLLIFLFVVYFPSLAYFPSKFQKVQRKLGERIMLFFISIFAMFVLLYVMLKINFFTFISLAVLQSIGIIDNQENTYFIKNNSYVITDFPTDIWQTQKGLNTENRIFIKGVSAISLDDTVLICPKNFVQLRKNALKSKVTDIFNNNKSKSLIKFQQENRKCITFNKSEITRWNFIE